MSPLVHDTIVTAPLLIPIQEGWLTVPFAVSARSRLAASDIGPDDIALIPAAEIAALQESHQVIPEVAVVNAGDGAVALRVPVRPDEVERTPVLLYEVSGVAELLARATIQPFYGIQPLGWTREPAADIQAVVVEGETALTPPEAGFAEDLVRAWFILTGQPVVSHLLIAPKAAGRAALQPVIDGFVAAAALAHERRRELRKLVAERTGLDRDRLTRLFAAQRHALTPEDQRALLMLLQRGNRGSAYPYVWDLAFLASRE